MISKYSLIALCLLALATTNVKSQTTPVPCPECGLVAVDPTEACVVEFTVCVVPDVVTLYCVDDTCFNSETCVCEEHVPACPTCGFSPDPTGDAGSFCYCESAPSVCGLECAPNTIFDQETCGCTAPVCQPCGLRKASGDDCSEYYACDYATGLDTDGPYFCPGANCFDEANCAC